jgi:hypothetical protein
MVTTPLVTPDRPMVPVLVPATPRTGVTVKDGTPDDEAFKIPPLAVANPATTLAELL